MSRTKKRMLTLNAGLALVVGGAAAATHWSVLWTVLFSLIASLFVTARAPIDDEPRAANYPAKATVLVLTAAVGVGCVVVGIGDDWRLIVLGAVLVGVAVPGLWLVAHARNPWWL